MSTLTENHNIMWVSKKGQTECVDERNTFRKGKRISEQHTEGFEIDTDVGWPLAVSAGSIKSGLHVTLLYVLKPTLEIIHMVCAEYVTFVMSHLPPNERGDYMLDYTRGEMWGRYSMLLHGRIANFHEELDAYMRSRFPEGTFADKRKTHVNVRGDPSSPLYPEFNAFVATSNTRTFYPLPRGQSKRFRPTNVSAR